MKTFAIINSRTGTRTVIRMRALLESEVKLNGNDILCTEYAGHARELAQELSSGNCDLIIACGGDGTINEIINGMNLKKCVLAIIPMGTANDLACHYCIPTNLRRALSLAVSGDVHRQDLISINEWKCATVGGVGLGRHAIQAANAIRACRWTVSVVSRILGHRLYSLGLLLAVLKRDRKRLVASLQWDDDKTEGSYESIVFGNQALLGNQFRVLPDAINDDGQLDAFTISAQVRSADLLSVVYRVLKGNLQDSEHVRYMKCKRLVVEMNQPSRIFCDGEIGDLHERLNIKILPKALRVIVPKGWIHSDQM